MCKWSAENSKVFILWGDKGVYELSVQGKAPEKQNQAAMKGLKLAGKRVADGKKCDAIFQRVFDHEAADLDKDLYEMLGIPDDTDEAEIKKVYRKLSIKYHPDKNPDEASKQRFAEVRDAYEILNDPDKKILYDTGGMEAVKSAEKGEVEKGEEASGEMPVTLEDLYNGGQRAATHDRRVVCRGCRVKPDSPKCKGCGRCPNEIKNVNVQVGPGMFMQQQQEVSSKEKCKQEEATIPVQIERGMRDGEKLTFPRMGEQKPGMLPGDVILNLKCSKHSKFERHGDDLHMKMKISLRESLLGWSQTIVHLDGHRIEFATESVTKSLQIIKIQGEGMPLRDDPSSFGDLLIKIEIAFPATLQGNQRTAVEAIFAAVPSRPEL